MAYEHYKKGRYSYFRYEPRAFMDALCEFEKATKIDLGYANAYAQQAYCRTALYVFGLPGADETLNPAEELARKAIEIAPTATLGHVRLGWVFGYCERPNEHSPRSKLRCALTQKVPRFTTHTAKPSTGWPSQKRQQRFLKQSSLRTAISRLAGNSRKAAPRAF